MVVQSLIIEITEEDKIILSSTKDIENLEWESDETFKAKLLTKNNNSEKVYDVTLKNCKITDKLNKYDYIQCKGKDNYIENIYLLEESGYKLEFKGDSKRKNKKLFNFLKRNDSNDIKFDSWDKGGFINFKSYAGKTFIDLEFDDYQFKIPLEVMSKKIHYKYQYRSMIEDLAEYTSNLMLHYKGPIYQSQSLEGHRESNYDYFLILTYIFRNNNLPSVYEYLSRNLISTITTDYETKPINFVSNIGINEIVNISFNPEKMVENDTYHIVHQENKCYVPSEIIEEVHTDTIDNLENRFYKYFLELLEDIIESLLLKITQGYEYELLSNYKEEVSNYLSTNYFKHISKLDFLPLNSQVLQKKEGYRDILKYYFMLEYGTTISWTEFDNTVKGYQKRLSQMYEMWGFFELLSIIEDITSTKITDELVKSDENGLSINIEEGKVIDSFELKNVNDKDVQIKFYYNKTFNKNTEYPTYSIELRPDFTIELIYDDKRKFIHFDTKYKVYNKNNNILSEKNNKSNENDVNEGNESFKYEDIKKMHTYKDAIPGTIGSFVLYPGDIEEIFEEEECTGRGVGAYPLNPKDENKPEEYESNRKNIKKLIDTILVRNVI